MKSGFVCAAMILALFASRTRADDDQKQKDLDALKGEWTVVQEIGLDGKKTGPQEGAVQTIIFMSMKGRFRWPELKTAGTFTIDPSKDPPTLDFNYVDPGDKTKYDTLYIYKFDGDKLVLGWRVGGYPKSWDDPNGLGITILKRKQ